MTPEERKAAAEAMRAEIEADRASRPAKVEKARDLYAGAKPAASAAPAAAADPATTPGTVEYQIEEQRRRAGGYLRNQSTDHMN